MNLVYSQVLLKSEKVIWLILLFVNYEKISQIAHWKIIIMDEKRFQRILKYTDSLTDKNNFVITFKIW